VWHALRVSSKVQEGRRTAGHALLAGATPALEPMHVRLVPPTPFRAEARQRVRRAVQVARAPPALSAALRVLSDAFSRLASALAAPQASTAMEWVDSSVCPALKAHSALGLATPSVSLALWAPTQAATVRQHAVTRNQGFSQHRPTAKSSAHQASASALRVRFRLWRAPRAAKNAPLDASVVLVPWAACRAPQVRPTRLRVSLHARTANRDGSPPPRLLWAARGVPWASSSSWSSRKVATTALQAPTKTLLVLESASSAIQAS